MIVDIVWWVVAAAFFFLGSTFAVIDVMRGRRDKAYASQVPGLAPVDGQSDASGFRDTKAPVAVQFNAPTGISAGLVGVVIDGSADPCDIAAIIVDLARRKYLRLTHDDEGKRWEATQVEGANPGELLPFEQELWRVLFGELPSLQPISTPQTAALAAVELASETRESIENAMYRECMRRKLFARDPRNARGSWMAYGIVYILCGIGAWAVFQYFGLAQYGVMPVAGSLGLFGLVLALISPLAPSRSPQGSAVLAQALGYRLYLSSQITAKNPLETLDESTAYAVAFDLPTAYKSVTQLLGG